MQIEKAFTAAVQNIARHGDTDVVPFPIENHVFFDKPSEAVKILMDMHADLPKAIEASPPNIQGLLASVGYTGFRWVAQIEPIWNAYFLGLVIAIGDRIEAVRLPVTRGSVFSYRFSWDDEEKTLFRRDIGWAAFQQESVTRARTAKFVLACDISDFYPRIYHHRLENALHKATRASDECWRVMLLLNQFSNNVSYGLPVGGPAARLLSELLLDSVDRLLAAQGVNFCRFADDYHIFAESAQEAYRHLLFLSEKLVANEGLLLQKSKTRVMSAEEFLGTSEFADENRPEGEGERVARDFLRLRLHYDPYSPTAIADYEALKEEVDRFDVLGMLAREMRKSRVHQALARKLIGALRLLDAASRDAAILSLMDNLSVLYPVYPSIMILVKAVIDDMQPGAREEVFRRLRTLVSEGAYTVIVPTHLAYTVRVLAHDSSQESDEILSGIYYNARSSAVIRRDVILAMARRGATYWVSDVKRSFATLTSWERTALVVASYALGDEGKHWRTSVRNHLSRMQMLVRDWAAERAAAGNREVPL